MKKFVILILSLLLVSSFSALISFAEDEGIEEEDLPALNLNLKVETFKTSSVTLKWDDTGSEIYTIYQYDFENKEYIKIAETNETTYKVTELNSGSRYVFKVYDSNSNEKVRCATSPKKPYSLKEKNKKTEKAYISFKEKGGYTGFEICYSKSKNFDTKTIKYSSKKYIYLKNLKKDTCYYVKVRGYKVVDGKKYYGSYSSVKKFRYHAFKKKNKIMYIDGVMIVNKTYGLPSSYGSGLKKKAKSAFAKMKKQAKKDGAYIYIASGYRSYSYQKNLYKSYKSIYGKSVTDTFSARPGHSEHQSGYAIDLNTIKSSFAKTKEGKWIAKNCYKYGFIIRYPEGKKKYTGYKYEPWHIRYVGEKLAKELYNNGDWISMEEYFGISSKY